MMRNIRLRLNAFRFPVAVALLTLTVGCGKSEGPDMGTVTGTVTVNGEPQAGLDVVFQPESGRPSLGQTDASGRYELIYSVAKKGAMVGTHSVIIAVPEADPESDVKPPDMKIPAKYNEKTELTATVEGGRNKFDFNIELE